jgi:polyhydroxybutyrate depolymerase
MLRPHLALLALPILSLPLLAACSSGGAATTAGTGSGGAGTSSTSASGGAGGGGSAGGAGGGGASSSGGTGGAMPIGGDRPVTVHVPPGYAQGTPTPLVILLHGYSASGAIEDLYLGLTAESDKRGFLYAHPDGTIDGQGEHFWNATDACCNFNGSTVDDSGYLSSLITEIAAKYSVDPKRVYFFGHSNGGFMSYRMACDHADQVAAIVSLAGAMPTDVSLCKPSGPVSVLEVHGTADTTIAYDGASIGGHPFPGATTTIADWVTLDGCSPTADTSAPMLDLEATLPGAETTVTKYATGCKPGGGAELWTITGAEHIPNFTSAFVPDAVDFLYAHPKP